MLYVLFELRVCLIIKLLKCLLIYGTILNPINYNFEELSIRNSFAKLKLQPKNPYLINYKALTQIRYS